MQIRRRARYSRRFVDDVPIWYQSLFRATFEQQMAAEMAVFFERAITAEETIDSIIAIHRRRDRLRRVNQHLGAGRECCLAGAIPLPQTGAETWFRRPSLAGVKRGRAADSTQHKLAPYAFISPFYILFGLFFLAPSVMALVLSLFRWDGINDPRFVLARNYGRSAQ